MRRIVKPMVFLTALTIGLMSSAVTNLIGLRSKAPRVVTMASGLKYIDSVEGSGVQPLKGQVATVTYIGTFESGSQFDNSIDRGEGFEFTLGVGQVIQGFDEGVMTMKVGGKRKLIIPSALAYGHRGHPSMIPPDATLIYDVELIGVR